MDTEKIKVCIICLSDSPSALENLKGIIPSCTDLPLILSQILTAVSDRLEIQETVKAIGRLKPEMVFIVLPSSHLKQALSFVHSLHVEGLNQDTLAFLEELTSDATIDLLKLGIVHVISPPLTEENVVPRVWRILNNSRDPDEKLICSLKEKIGLWRLIRKNAGINGCLLGWVAPTNVIQAIINQK